MTDTKEDEDRATRNDGSMSLMDHLKELRNRVFKSMVAMLIGGIVVYFFYDSVYRFAVQPYCEAIKDTSQDTCQLLFTSLTAPFATKLRVSTYAGLMLASPFIFWQLWSFIAPGLYRKEKRYAISFVTSSVVLFTLGAALAYISLPAIFEWLINEAGDATVQSRGEDYFSLLTLMVAAFGLSFEFPLLLLALQLMGIVTPDKLASLRRHAIVSIVMVVAIVTPGGDPISLFILSIPLCLFYEASIWVARLLLRRRART